MRKKDIKLGLIIASLFVLISTTGQGCLMSNGSLIAGNAGGEGVPFMGTLIPEGEYVRRTENYGCNDVQASLVSDGKEATLLTDNCTDVNQKVDNSIVDIQSYNPWVFGLGFAIMRRVEDGGSPFAAPYDLFFCRYNDGVTAHDFMIYKSTNKDYFLETIGAERDSMEEPWVRTQHSLLPLDDFGNDIDSLESIPLSGGRSLIVDKDDAASAFTVKGSLVNGSGEEILPLDCRTKSDEAVFEETVYDPNPNNVPTPRQYNFVCPYDQASRYAYLCNNPNYVHGQLMF